MKNPQDKMRNPPQNSPPGLFPKRKRYRMFLAMLLIYLLVTVIFPNTGRKAADMTWQSLLEMISVLPPVFILLGLLDVWVKRETMVRYMGQHAGIIGVLLAFLLGSAAAGPLYAAFPVAAVLLKKGSRLSNVLIMLGAWSTTKIPLILFEASALGIEFMLLRFALNLFGIAVIAFLTEKALSPTDKEAIYRKAETL